MQGAECSAAQTDDLSARTTGHCSRDQWVRRDDEYALSLIIDEKYFTYKGL